MALGLLNEWIVPSTPDQTRSPSSGVTVTCAGVLSCPRTSALGNTGVATGGGGALRFFTSGFAVIPEMLPRDSDEPRLLEREFTEGEFGAVEKPCKWINILD